MMNKGIRRCVKKNIKNLIRRYEIQNERAGKVTFRTMYRRLLRNNEKGIRLPSPTTMYFERLRYEVIG